MKYLLLKLNLRVNGVLLIIFPAASFFVIYVINSRFIPFMSLSKIAYLSFGKDKRFA